MFKLIVIIDSFISSEFIFALRKYYSIDLTQAAAAQNILIRASTAVAPAAALSMLAIPQLNFGIAIFVFILISLSIYQLKDIFFSESNLLADFSKKPLSFSKLISNPYMRWGIAYQFLGNLAFAGVSFLLLKNLPLNADLFFNEITALYFSFFVVQIIILLYGEDIVPANQTSHIAIIMGLTGCFVILASLSHHSVFRLIYCLIIGLLYSFTLSSVQKVVTVKMRGSGYVEYVGWAQMIGRFTSFVVTLLFGFALSLKVDTSILLTTCGLFGIASAFILTIIKVNKEFQMMKSDSVIIKA